MPRKILPAVLQSSVKLSVEERAALTADVAIVPPGYCKMTVANPVEHNAAFCSWGQGQRSLFQQDFDSGPAYVVVPKSEVEPLSRSGYVLQK